MDLSTFPTWLVIAGVLLALVQVTLVVVALVDLYRRPAAQLAFGNKPLWAVIIILVNIVGPVVYLAAGRRRPFEGGEGPAPPSARPSDVADALYRRREEGEQV